jgi:hypothetical protein
MGAPIPEATWIGPGVTAALVTGPLAFIGTIFNVWMTAQLAKRRAMVDTELTELKGQIEKGLAERRYAVEQEIEKLRGEINRGIEDRRRQAEEKLAELRDSLEQRQANKRHFFEQQLELCFSAVESASCLSCEIAPVEWEKARLAFWRLYWGKLSIVEDQAVEAAMVALGKIVPAEPVTTPILPMASLQIPSYKLAHAARDLVLRSWHIEMPEPLEPRVLPRPKE